MRVARTLEEFRAARAELRGPVGLVPTMGYLHQGHLSLVQMSRQRCASTIVTIFVNPTQFNDPGDLQAYPRDEEADLAMLGEVDLVFLPTPETIYPEGYQTFVEVNEVSRPLEGARRPGHFRGVATVVTKLFILTAPQFAFFGAKDAQQVVVIRRLVKDLGFALEVVVGETVRDGDGLALSSRNSRLASTDRAAAVSLSRALRKVQQAYAAGCASARQLAEEARTQLHPGVDLEYLAFNDPLTLAPQEMVGEGTLVSLAAQVGKVRLIDNVTL